MDIFPDHRNFWHFRGILALIALDTFNLPCCHSFFPARLSFFTKLIKPLEAFWRLQGIPIAIFFFSMMVSALVPLAILRNLTFLSSAQVSLNPVF